MSLIQQIMQKTQTIAYKFRARTYKKSHAWVTHRHNRQVPPTDWYAVQNDLSAICHESNVHFSDYSINISRYKEFKNKFKLGPLSLYAIRCREKKLLEHYIAFNLLNLKHKSRYIDIASENSPFPNLVRKQLGLEAYSQDLTYSPGINGYQIGSSADALPVPNSWADGASLQCAFEHFQKNIDSDFIRELARVLKPSGRCVIVPLYLNNYPLNIYDPILYPEWNDTIADEGATIVAELALGGHFERIYSPATLNRVLISGIGLTYSIFRITDLNKLAETEKISSREHSNLMRVNYALLIEKEAAQPRH